MDAGQLILYGVSHLSSGYYKDSGFLLNFLSPSPQTPTKQSLFGWTGCTVMATPEPRDHAGMPLTLIATFVGLVSAQPQSAYGQSH